MPVIPKPGDTDQRRNGSMDDIYNGATESELRASRASGRINWLSDQRLLFPHTGRLSVESEALVLGDWWTIPKADITDAQARFTEAYGRAQAAGVRGGNVASFGLFGSLGKPLVLTLRNDEPIYLLIGFRYFTGVTQARRWAPLLRDWIDSEVGTSDHP
jgi:hypothetical protein